MNHTSRFTKRLIELTGSETASQLLQEFSGCLISIPRFTANQDMNGFTPLSATQAARRLRLLLDQKSEQLDGRKTSAQEPAQVLPFQVIEKPQERALLCTEHQPPRSDGAEQ